MMETRLRIQTKTTPPPSFSAVRGGGVLQRKCACGGTPGPTGECEACRQKRLQRKIGNARSEIQDQSFVPQIVHEVLRSPGQPLDPTTRAFMEPRFGYDFSRVRVHTDVRAAESAQTLAAEAFTVRKHISFAPGRYSPNTASGRQLLAHELTHTIQQRWEEGSPEEAPGPARPSSLSDLRALDENPFQEAEAERASRAIAGEPSAVARLVSASSPVPAIQRKVEVNNPTSIPSGAPAGETHEKIIRDYLATLCPDFTIMAGEVMPTTADFCLLDVASSVTPEACGCLCEMHTLQDPVTGADIVWTIDVNDNDWPHTDPATKTVTVHSPFSGAQFGAWAQGASAHRTTQPNWLVLGHELCGHARLFERGTHPTGPPPTHGGRPSHDVTVQIENKIAAEHGVPASELRGLFADPHHGESFARVTVGQFPSGSASIAALPPAEQHQLDLAEAFIKSAPVKMDVIGHADQPAKSAGANTSISQQRANNVKAELVRRRTITPGRFLIAKGVSDSECSLPGDQPLCRKVDIFMFMMEGASVTHR
jgi:outer membrane protein OmpA-like peptidoglycan-associated protein